MIRHQQRPSFTLPLTKHRHRTKHLLKLAGLTGILTHLWLPAIFQRAAIAQPEPTNTHNTTQCPASPVAAGIASFPGRLGRMSPNRQQVITYFEDNDRAQLYDLAGNELASFEGLPTHFSRDGQILLTSSFQQQTVRLYAIIGNEIATIKGAFAEFSTDDTYIITSAPATNRSWLYNRDGQEVGTFQGSGATLSADGQRVLTYTQPNTYASPEEDAPPTPEISWLYDLSGQELAQLPGTNAAFNPTGTHLLTSSPTKTLIRLFDATGAEIASVPGEYAFFSPTGQYIATLTQENSVLYNLSGEQIATLTGHMAGFSPDGQTLITHDFKSNRSFLYDIAGNEILSVSGVFPSLNPFQQTFIAVSSPRFRGIRTLLYDPTGTLMTSFDSWPLGQSHTGQYLLTAPFTTIDNQAFLHSWSGHTLATLKGESAQFNWAYPSTLQPRVFSSSRKDNRTWIYKLNTMEQNCP